jgi:tetratricopeptide (TPR) repeat protein
MWTGDAKYDESIEMLNKMLTDESNARQADAYRVRISQVCDLAGRYEDAIAYLRAVDEEGDLAGAKQAIPELEKKIKENAQ